MTSSTAWIILSCVFCPTANLTRHASYTFSYHELVASLIGKLDMASVDGPSSGLSSVLYSGFHLPAPPVFLPSHYLCICSIQRPNQFFFLHLMVSDTLLFYTTLPSTSSFFTISCHEIHSILLRVNNSKSCNLFSYCFLTVKVSVLYRRSALQTKHFTTHFLSFNSNCLDKM